MTLIPSDESFDLLCYRMTYFFALIYIKRYIMKCCCQWEFSVLDVIWFIISSCQRLFLCKDCEKRCKREKGYRRLKDDVEAQLGEQDDFYKRQLQEKDKKIDEMRQLLGNLQAKEEEVERLKAQYESIERVSKRELDNEKEICNQKVKKFEGEKKSFEKQLETVKAENSRLEKLVTKNEKELLGLQKVLQETKKNAQVDIEKMTGTIKEFELERGDSNKKVGEMNTKVKEVEEKLYVAQMESIKTKSLLKMEEENHKKTEAQIGTLQAKIQESEKILNDAKEETEKTISSMGNELVLEKQKVIDVERELQSAKEKATKFQTKFEENEEVLDSTQLQLAKVENKYDQAIADEKTLKQKIKKMETELSHSIKERVEKEKELKTEILKNADIVTELKKDNEKLKESYQQLETQLSNTQIALEKSVKNEKIQEQKVMEFDRKIQIYERIKQVNVFTTKGNGDFKDTDADILKQLKAQLSGKRYELSDHEWVNQAPNGKGSWPLMLFCINTSRLGTDADAAIQKAQLQGSTELILVIFHHVPKHKIDQITASKGLLPQNIKDRTSAIIDCAFWGSSGLHECDLNTEAVNILDLRLRQIQLKYDDSCNGC